MLADAAKVSTNTITRLERGEVPTARQSTAGRVSVARRAAMIDVIFHWYQLISLCGPAWPWRDITQTAISEIVEVILGTSLASGIAMDAHIKLAAVSIRGLVQSLNAARP